MEHQLAYSQRKQYISMEHYGWYALVYPISILFNRNNYVFHTERKARVITPHLHQLE